MAHCTRRALFGLPLIGYASRLLAEEPRISPEVTRLLTDEEEIRLGRKVSAKVLEQTPALESDAIHQYVNQIVSRLAQKSQRASLAYPVRVLNSPIINASATFGGYLHVYRGLLHFSKDESELAGVLSHEVGHVVGRHCVKALARDAQLSGIVRLAKATLGINDTIFAQLADIIVGVATALPTLHLSREDELEADRLGLYQMNRAGFNPDGLLSFLTRLQVDSPDPGLIDTLLSTHPPPVERQAALRAELREMPKRVRSADLSSSFTAMKEALAALPPPPKLSSRNG